VDLIKAIESGPEAGNTLILVTYDEFGGQWDHVPPPGMGTPGVHDEFGPGTRIPAILIARSLTRSGVDHTPTTRCRSCGRSRLSGFRPGLAGPTRRARQRPGPRGLGRPPALIYLNSVTM
jgi:hypothetical protein